MKKKLLLIIIVIAFFAFPKVNFGQTIDLGAAANFVLYTSGGAVHDNASSHSHLTGDVGYYTSGDFLGFGNVNGVMRPGVDAATTACELALQSALIQINGTTDDYFPGLLLGNAVVFTPGVYSVPGNATLNLDLVLDAQNVPSAQFIIKINGTFATNAGAKVRLINGAQACNVFWRINGLVTMATNTTMRGSIITDASAINMATGDSLEGRLLCATSGAITIDGITAFTPQGCGSAVLTGPPSPPLGSIACFTLFSSDGALTNTAGTTTVIGDVGNNGIGSITGWTPADVTGTIHLIQDAATIQAAVDLSNLYDTLNAMVPDIELLYPAQFGLNLTLTPHVYVMNSAATFTDSLYLDAQGNANGVFVIKIVAGSPALNTSTYSRVKLINGAQAKNVYWLIKGEVSINNYSDFKGTIVIPSGALNLVNTGLVLEGRALTMVGAITTAGLAAAMPPGCSILPCDTLKIITEPISQTACAGDSVSFSVGATGTGLSYQWRKGTIPLINGGNISGADSATLIINPVTILDTASNYNVLITGSCGPNDSSINVSLAVNIAPIIITEPVSQTACAGDSVSFSVVASGSGLMYQWRKGTTPLINGGNISGADSSTLTINPVTLADTASNYNVLISGSCGPNDSSIYVSLQVNTSPIIITEPSDQTVCAGDSASFTVVASGSNLMYRWRKGTTPLINGGNISGADSATLIINPANAPDTASNYNVVITGSCGPNDTSINVSLALNTVPVIITQPVSQTVCDGDSVSFVVVASGTGITYQWRKGTVNLIDGGNISGTTSDTLTINPATISDVANNYNVVVSGVCIATDSSAFSLTSANGFAILAGTAITSTGFSEIHDMNVGISPGVRSSITGFPPAIVVNGAIYASDDVAPPGVAAMLIQAKQDLTDAYLFAEGATAPAPVTVAGDQGGRTLTPGIYKSTSTLLIQSGDLTLDAQGDVNAKWIFQIASDFTTIGGAGGNVILTGGAQASNITWQVGSSATIGNYTSFAGNILALTSITMNTGSSIDGRLLARNGAVVLSGTNIINGPTDSIVTAVSQDISVNVSLTVNPKPTVNSVPTGIICSGVAQNYTITSTIPGTTYNWSRAAVAGISNLAVSNQTSNPITEALINTSVAPVSVIYLITPTATGCSGSAFIYTVTVNPAPSISSAVTGVICNGSALNYTITSAVPGTTFIWSRDAVVGISNAAVFNQASNPITELLTNTTAAPVNVTYLISPSANGCTGTTFIYTVTVNPIPTVNSASTGIICSGSAQNYSITSTIAGTTYSWDRAAVAGISNVAVSGQTSNVITEILINTTTAAVDVVYLITPSVNGCSGNTFTYTVTVNSSPIAVAGGTTTICAGSSIFLTAQTVIGASYLWTGPNGFSSTDQNPVIISASIADAGIYSLTVTVNGCTSTPSTVTILVGDCSADLSIVKTVNNANPIIGQTVVFTIVATNNGPNNATGVTVTDILQSGYTYISSTTTTGSFDPLTGVWTIGNLNVGVIETLTITVSVNTSGVYVNTATIVGNETDVNSINDVSVIEVFPTDFFIPEGFSPNSDGVNDLFVIRGIDNYPGNTFVVFNRWGDKLFEASPYHNNWDGKAKIGLIAGGGLLPVGTYFYLLDLNNGSDVIKGTIYLNK
jgi:uncharacterized repeat protein (TIGR01451 family)/gliding motility-associated-like protein